MELFRITSVVSNGISYIFYDGAKEVHRQSMLSVYFIPTSIACPLFDWQKPVLKLDGSKVFFGGRLLYDRDMHQRTKLQETIATFPVNPNLEKEIDELPILWRIGLKAMLYMPNNGKADLAYLSLLLWLNQKAVNIYKRHNSLDLKNVPYWRSSKMDSDVVSYGYLSAQLAFLLEHEDRRHPFCAAEYIDELQIEEFDLLPDKDKEVVATFVQYMMSVNDAIHVDHYSICSDLDRSLTKTMPARFFDFVNINNLHTWKKQDLLETNTLSKETMEEFRKLFFV